MIKILTFFLLIDRGRHYHKTGQRIWNNAVHYKKIRKVEKKLDKEELRMGKLN